MPSVSVLMPVRNGSAYLDEAVQSILDQSFTDFEFLILDDGSTDNSLAMLQSYARRDPRIRLMSRENKGLTYTLNELIGKARGELMARMDADDIAMPDRMVRQMDFMRLHPAVLCAGGAFALIDQAGRYLTTLRPPTSNSDIQDQLVRGHCAIAHPTVMARLQPIRALGGYQCDLAEDLDLWLRLGEKGELANLRDVMLKYRLHPASISERAGEGQRDAGRLACEAAWRRRGISNGVYEAGFAWRPGSDVTQYQFALRYGWWAWNSRERTTAQIYALKAVRARPFRSGGWKLLMVSLLKPFDAPLPQSSRG